MIKIRIGGVPEHFNYAWYLALKQGHFKKQNMNNLDKNTDFETRSLDTVCINESQLEHKWYHNIKYLIVGLLFGTVFIKAEIISWFRIQEMFRFQSFHMFGIIGGAVVVSLIFMQLLPIYGY